MVSHHHRPNHPNYKGSIPTPSRVNGIVDMEHRLASTTQIVMNDFAANQGLSATHTFTNMFELAPRVRNDAKLTNGPAANHVSNTSSGQLLHKYVDAYLASAPTPAVRNAGQSLGSGFGGDGTDAALVEKMQASFGWENAKKLGLGDHEVSAIAKLNPDEMRAAQMYLKGDPNFEHTDPAMAQRLAHFPGKKGEVDVLAALNKIHDGITQGSPVMRSATCATALNNINAGHVIDGHYGPETEKAWDGFIKGPGREFAMLPANMGLDVAVPVYGALDPMTAGRTHMAEFPQNPAAPKVDVAAKAPSPVRTSRLDM